MSEPEWQDWHGCYEQGWGDLIVKDAYRHPAKMARGLLERILDFGLARGFWRPGDLLGDPFGGIGTTGLLAAYRGLRCVSVELESEANGGSPFVELARRNYEARRRELEILGCPLPVLAQGDSRRFAEIVAGIAGAVTSPPYAETRQDGGGINLEGAAGTSSYSDGPTDQWRTTRPQANIGNLPAGAVEGVVTSPPFLATEGGCKAVGGIIDGRLMARHNATGNGRYGDTPGQIGALPPGHVAAVVTSPPYAESITGGHGETETAEQSRAARKTRGGSLGQSQRHGGYGVTGGQIGALKEGELAGAVTSPPYAPNEKSDRTGEARDPMPLGRGCFRTSECYGDSEGQIGALRDAAGPETYWQAMAQVYAQVFLALKPGGVAAVVLKDYVKSKKRVPLCDQSAALLGSLGFDVFLRCRCRLVKEERHAGLYGEEIVERTERKSFFRRLAEKKGSPRIDWEETLWCKKPVDPS